MDVRAACHEATHHLRDQHDEFANENKSFDTGTDRRTDRAGVAFWIDRFGFAKTNEVVGEDGSLVFASVEKDGIEIMYQTRASVLAERADAAIELEGHSVIVFVEVASLDAVETSLAGAPIVKPRHRTFYGSEGDLCAGARRQRRRFCAVRVRRRRLEGAFGRKCSYDRHARARHWTSSRHYRAVA